MPNVELLDRSIYKPSNITFLIDVSASMRDSLNLPLLKEAMYSLIVDLREIDHVNLITYSNEPRIVKEGIRGDEKQDLIKSISKLTAQGPTMGAKAILFSLDIVLNQYKEEANNQLFLVTDGRFKYNERLHKQWKEKAEGKLIAFTVIALGDDFSAIAQLQEMTKEREGTFIRIENKEQAGLLLLADIKIKSQK